MKQEEQSGAAAQPAAASGDELSTLLQKPFRPQTETMRRAIADSLRKLAELALSDSTLVSDDAVSSIQGIIAGIDDQLTQQINQILHHPEFQKLEGSWRGLHHLVSKTETGTDLKIRVMSVSKRELHKSLKRYKGANWDQSPVFKKLYEEEYGTSGGEPYGCIVADYHFDHTGPDLEMLGELAKTAAAAHAPIVAGASSELFQMESWRELSNPKELAAIFATPEYATWRALRQSEESRYIGLTLPRFLARRPYGAKSEPVEEFAFEEDAGGPDGAKFTWANSAFAMAANISRSFKQYGWCSQIRGMESGGRVEDLPVHTFPTDDGNADMTCPTEIAITDRREAELAAAGFMPLVHQKNSDVAAFIGAQSLQAPPEFADADATANARLSARLPYLFATCRFAHYLKCLARDKVGGFASADDMRKALRRWVLQYVDADPANSSAETKAKKPLTEADVTVEEAPDNPGYYLAQFYLRPHYQLEGLTASLRLVSKLPSERDS